jgi:hypothetical protein
MKRDICEKRVSEYLNSATPVVDQDRFAGLISWVDLLDAALGNCSPHGGCERNG